MRNRNIVARFAAKRNQSFKEAAQMLPDLSLAGIGLPSLAGVGAGALAANRFSDEEDTAEERGLKTTIGALGGGLAGGLGGNLLMKKRIATMIDGMPQDGIPLPDNVNNLINNANKRIESIPENLGRDAATAVNNANTTALDIGRTARKVESHPLLAGLQTQQAPTPNVSNDITPKYRKKPKGRIARNEDEDIPVTSNSAATPSVINIDDGDDMIIERPDPRNIMIT